MAEFVSFTGPMDCAKSTPSRQLDYTDTSALGLARPADEVDP